MQIAPLKFAIPDGATLAQQRLLPGLLTLLVVVGAIMLGLGQFDRSPILAAVVLAPLSYLITDVWRRFRLHRLIANLLAIVVVVLTMRDFFKHDTSGQLFSIARMLVFLQLVLLFQEKNHRLVWQILVLSLLDIVVAAALNLGVWFGLLLVIYLLLAIAVIVMLYLEHELTGPSRKEQLRRKSTVPWQGLLGSPQPIGAYAPAEITRKLPGFGSIALQSLGILVPAALFAIAFFVAVPRVRANAWLGGERATGFAADKEMMVMRERGTIMTSERPVMRVSLLSGLYRMPITAQDEFYLHGAVMNRYQRDQFSARWHKPEQSGANGRRGRPAMPRGIPLANETVVDITLEPTPSPYLFCILPVKATLETPDDVFLSQSLVRLRRRHDEEVTPAEYSYEFATTAFKRMRQLRAVPQLSRLQTWEDAVAFRQYLESYTQFDAEYLPRLKEKADKIVGELDPLYASSLTKGLALQSYLQQSGEYRYSLQLSTKRNIEFDPVEDFVVNHRQGHCEYFAAALTLMLRSQGIPARLVLGYKGGDFNPLGHYYIVREKHAHAWVEMYLPADEVPASEWAGSPSPAGAWYRLDPTPTASDEAHSGPLNPVSERLSQAVDYADVVWREYILSMGMTTQRDSLYDPFLLGGELAPEIALMQLSPGGGLRLGKDSSGLIGWIRGQRGAMAPMGLAGLIAIGMLLWWYRGAKLFSWKRFQRTKESRASVFEFYDRLLRLLSQHGIRRKQSQTSSEVEAEALRAWRSTPERAPLVPQALETVLDGYRRARFGGEQLDAEQSAAIERSLEQISLW